MSIPKKSFIAQNSCFSRNTIDRDQLDRDQAAEETAKAAVAAAKAQATSADASIESATAKIESIKANLDDTILKSPTDGRVQYRLAEPGEVLPAGGKVVTLIDITDVYMTFFLPTKEAGKLVMGGDARIVLDVLPDRPIPATVSFVSPTAQFTPKEVETRAERREAHVPHQSQNRSGSLTAIRGPGENRVTRHCVCETRAHCRLAGKSPK